MATSSRKRFASTTSWRVFGCLGNAITRQAGASERDCWQALEFFKEEKNNALVFSFIPVLTVGSQDGRFVLDLGVGGALLSRHTFEKQDYGGHFQFAVTAGASVPLYGRLGVGYRFMHYSDAGIHGTHTTGADFHMVELIYRF